MPEIPKIPLFFTGMDLDTEPRGMGIQTPPYSSPMGSYRRAKNIHLGFSDAEAGGVPTYAKGTVEIIWERPAGRNKCVGTHWDEAEDTQIAFIWNENGEHSVLRYFPETRTINVVAQGSAVGLSEDRLVTGVNLVNRRFLQWVDGGEPKQINIQRADNTGKKFEIALYFPDLDSATVTRDFSVTITEDGNTVLALPAFSSSTAQEVSEGDDRRNWVDDFNASPASVYFTATTCKDYVELVAVNEGEWNIIPEYQDPPGGILPMVSEYTNRYTDQWQTQQISRAKLAPPCEPRVSAEFDPDRSVNLIENTVFQFAYAYRYLDAGRSTLSPYSEIPLNSEETCATASETNCILIDFDDEILSTAFTRAEIKAVEVFVRNGNESEWKSIDVLDKEEWVYTKQLTFYNDGLYPVIDPFYADRNFWQVPLKARSQENFADTDDNNRGIMAGITEGFDNTCLSAKFNVEYDQSTPILGNLGEITGTLRIGGPFYSDIDYINQQPIYVRDNNVGPVFGGIGSSTSYNTPQAAGQTIPTGGFPLYLVGTNFQTITEQNIFSVNASCGTIGPTIVPGTNVYDGTQAGAAINPCNRTHRAAIRIGIEAGQVYSTFSLKGIPPGTYALRVADHRCDFLDDNSNLDLNSPENKYQNTSSHTARVGTVNSAAVQSGLYECIITIPPGGGTIDIGEILVLDLTDGGIFNTVVHRGNVREADGQDHVPSTVDIRTFGDPAEKQWIKYEHFVAGIPSSPPPQAGAAILAAQAAPYVNEVINNHSLITDHNGHFYYAYTDVVIGLRSRAAWLSVTGDPFQPIGQILSAPQSGIVTDHLQILNNFEDNKWEGEFDSPSLTGPVSGNLSSNIGLTYYWFPNQVQGTRETIRTQVEGEVVTTSGDPVQNVLVLLENGQFGYTDNQGAFSITAYGDMAINDFPGANNNNRINDSLALAWDSGCQIFFITGSLQGPVLITQFDSNQPYSNSVPFPFGQIEALITSLAGGTGYKRDGGYDIGIVFKDEQGRSTAVQKLGSVRIAGITEDLNKIDPFNHPTPGTFEYGRPSIEWELFGDVPIPECGRFKYYHLVRTKDTRARFRFQWLVSRVEYVESYDDTAGSPVVVSFGSSSAREIYLYITDSLARYKEENSDSQLGYVFTKGDRVRIYTDSSYNFLPQWFDFPIREQRGEAIVIEIDPDLPELKGGEFFEIMTPKREEEDKKYYEIPGACFLINDYLTNPTLSVTSGVLPAGDTYLLSTQIPIRPVETGPWQTVSILRESESISDFYTSKDQNIGRIFFEDPDAKQEFRPTAIRFSNPFLPNTNVNGLAEFEPGNIREASRDYGLIQRVVEVSTVLICICSNSRTFAVYIGREETRTQSGETFLTKTNQVLGTIRPFAKHYGTLNPESVVRDRGWVKWVDRVNGLAVRYSVHGLDAISDNKAVSFFREKSRNINEFNEPRIFGGLDYFHDEYIITFAENQRVETIGGEPFDVVEPADTITFMERKNRWISFHDVFPEYWGRTRLKLFSWLEGRLYEHDSNERRGEFYGQKFEMSIDPVASDYPSTVKTWLSLSVEKGTGWYCPLIENTRGQRSNLIESDFTNDEGVSKAAFLKDELTPGEAVPLEDGDDLRSEELTIRIANNSDGEVILFAAKVYWSRSEHTFP